jgi:transmembrane sensor
MWQKHGTLFPIAEADRLMESSKTDKSNPIDTDESLDPISREAVVWFATLLNKDAAEAETTAFRSWLAADERHARAYAEVQRLWASAGTLPNLALIASVRLHHKKNLARSDFGYHSFVRKPLMVGLGLILLLAIWTQVPSHLFADYRTSKGMTRTVRLADGSIIELSTNTALSLDFNGCCRRVNLLSGTAFFQVAPDRTRPFIVEAAGGKTIAVGTGFVVTDQGDGAEIIDTEHSITVQVGQQTAHLSPGERIGYRNGHLEGFKRCDLATALAWRDRRLVFLSTPVSQVIDVLNQWLPGRTILLDRTLGTRRVTVIVDVRHSREAIDALTRTLPVSTVSLTRYLTLIYPTDKLI